MGSSGASDFWIQLVPITLLSVLSIIPSVRILRRVGKSWAWSLFALWPIIGLIVVAWIVAYSRWAAEPEIQSAPVSHVLLVIAATFGTCVGAIMALATVSRLLGW